MKGTIKILTTRAELIEVGDIIEVGKNRKWLQVSEVRDARNNEGKVVFGFDSAFGNVILWKLEPVRVQVTDGTPARS